MVTPQRIFEIAQINPLVSQALQHWLTGSVTFEQALMRAVESLYRHNEALMARMAEQGRGPEPYLAQDLGPDLFEVVGLGNHQ
ncbi:MAG: hypothetical protein PVF45_11115 [Anaerolineae bacterium]|jgi:hypothetical protein